MRFYIQEQKPKTREEAVITQELDFPTHREAYQHFISLALPANCILRDFQHYQVTEDNVGDLQLLAKLFELYYKLN